MDRMMVINDHLDSSLLNQSTATSLLLTLNRPKVLNALNQELLTLLHAQITSSGSRTIVLQGSGKAFCAGGDVVHLAKHPEDACLLFMTEFSLLYRISIRQGATVAIMKGPTMGGGAGLSAACKIRVATNSTIWAFPETVIGFIPDVGANFILPRLSSKAMGLYLALTGERLNGADCFQLGIATHFVEESRLPDLVEALGRTNDLNEVLMQFQTVPNAAASSVFTNLRDIEECFGGVTSIEELQSRLLHNGSNWAQKTLDTLNFMCPLSLKVELRLFELGATLSYGECLDREYDVVLRMTNFNNENFLVGVQHRLINKAKNRAPWRPASVTEVDETLVSSCLHNPTGPHLRTAKISE